MLRAKQTLTSSLTNFELLISLHCQVSVLDLFLPLSRLFQKSSLDVGYTRNVIKNLIETLKHIRTTSSIYNCLQIAEMLMISTMNLIRYRWFYVKKSYL
jgi:hypothetical protein